MSPVKTDNLSREKIRRLLAVAGSMPNISAGSVKRDHTPGQAPDAEQVEAIAYDWRRPRCFNSEQLSNLESLTKKFAEKLEEKFSQLYNNNYDVTIESTTQHFAGEIDKEILSSRQNDYYLSFGTGYANPFGFIGAGVQTASSWVSSLLNGGFGESESEKDSAASQDIAASKLSQLEQSLLLEIGTAVIEAFWVCFGFDKEFAPPCVWQVDSIKSVVTDIIDQVSVDPAIRRSGAGRTRRRTGTQQVEELCKITFAARPNGSEKSSDKSGSAGNQAYIIITCGKLIQALGSGRNLPVRRQGEGNDMSSGSTEAGAPASQVILEHIKGVPILITAQLAGTALTFEELIDIRPYDVLLLDKALNEPIDLIVQDQILFRGRPVMSGGQYAVLITESVCTKAKNPDAIAPGTKTSAG